ncbi:MAG: formate dehydrogenase accessory sulfurtransferase FdhD [Azonexus sp.]|jgi:FdhD protein|nr:formate dehydrogenase accessory sulfurtransferase FdhD [Azonexus sp.]
MSITPNRPRHQEEAIATQPPPQQPQLTRAERPATVKVSAINELGARIETGIAGEYPLTIYLDKHELVTLMTLGAHPELLVLGFLRNQRLVGGIADIAAVQVDWEAEAAAVTTRGGGAPLEHAERRTVTSGCGQGTMFGDLMTHLDAVSLSATARLDEQTLFTLLDNIRRRDTLYKQAGAIHGCALADARGEIIFFVEDVGRHNAVDTIAGAMWRQDMAGDDKIFYTTGRLTSEMVIKTAQMGIPILISRSGLTAMGYRIARQTGMTLIGRAQGRHYLLFSGEERFLGLPPEN